MFTGLIQSIATVTSFEDGILWVDGAASAIGASVAVNGCCLTVTHVDVRAASFDVTPETLSRTALGSIRAGSSVHLEHPLKIGDELGGHFVQGHVDAVAVVTSVDTTDGYRVAFEVPPALGRYVVEKGSIAIDGVSLTVTSADRDAFAVMLVPHTLSVTNLGALRAGDRVNIELDMLAKHVERLLQFAMKGA